MKANRLSAAPRSQRGEVSIRHLLGAAAAIIGTVFIFADNLVCTAIALALLAIGSMSLAGKKGATAC